MGTTLLSSSPNRTHLLRNSKTSVAVGRFWNRSSLTGTGVGAIAQPVRVKAARIKGVFTAPSYNYLNRSMQVWTGKHPNPRKGFGADSRICTGDLAITNRSLYSLS